MGPKQREMDSIIESIWNYLNKIRTNSENEQNLLLVVGDHGMTSAGGHGGSSYDETRPLLFFGFPNQKFNSKNIHWNIYDENNKEKISELK